MKKPSPKRALELSEQAFNDRLAQTRDAVSRLQDTARATSPALIVGSGLVTGAVLAQVPNRIWSVPMAGLMLVARPVAKLPLATWLASSVGRNGRRWLVQLRRATRALDTPKR